MGALLEKLFGPGAAPLVEIDTTGACASECCDEVEVVSSSSSSSEPHTHESGHAVTDSYNTIPPDIEKIPCESGTYAQAPGPSQTSGSKMDMKL